MTTHRDVAEDELLRCHVPQCIKKESRNTTTKGGNAYPKKKIYHLESRWRNSHVLVYQFIIAPY